MVSAGVPDEVPFQFTPKGVTNQARQGQNALIQRLGERLGIAAIGGPIQSGQAFGDMSNTGDRKANKAYEASMIRTPQIRKPNTDIGLGVPGVYVR